MAIKVNASTKQSAEQLAEQLTKEQIVSLLEIIIETKRSTESFLTEIGNDWMQGSDFGKLSLCDELLKHIADSCTPNVNVEQECSNWQDAIYCECTYCEETFYKGL